MQHCKVKLGGGMEITEAKRPERALEMQHPACAKAW